MTASDLRESRKASWDKAGLASGQIPLFSVLHYLTVKFTAEDIIMDEKQNEGIYRS